MINLIFSSLFLLMLNTSDEESILTHTSLITDPVITWPEDFMICVTDTSQILDLIDPDNLLPPFDRPIVSGPCNLPLAYGIAYEDSAFDFNLCTKIFRTWTVIDWCQYNPNKPNSPGKWTHIQVIKVIIKNGSIEPCGGL